MNTPCVESLEQRALFSVSTFVAMGGMARGAWHQIHGTATVIERPGDPNATLELPAIHRHIDENRVPGGNVEVEWRTFPMTGAIVPFGISARGTLYVDGSLANDTIEVVITGDKAVVSINQLQGFELSGFKRIGISGAGGNDAITLSGDPSVPVLILGGNGHDKIVAGGARVTLSGGAGNDVIHVTGEAGVTLEGGRGDDVLRGSSGDDLLQGCAGNDQLSGGPGSDTLQGNEGEDNLGVIFHSHPYDGDNDVAAIEPGDIGTAISA